jgi:hypothetical protein
LCGVSFSVYIIILDPCMCFEIEDRDATWQRAMLIGQGGKKDFATGG